MSDDFRAMLESRVAAKIKFHEERKLALEKAKQDKEEADKKDKEE